MKIFVLRFFLSCLFLTLFQQSGVLPMTTTTAAVSTSTTALPYIDRILSVKYGLGDQVIDITSAKTGSMSSWAVANAGKYMYLPLVNVASLNGVASGTLSIKDNAAVKLNGVQIANPCPGQLPKVFLLALMKDGSIFQKTFAEFVSYPYPGWDRSTYDLIISQADALKQGLVTQEMLTPTTVAPTTTTTVAPTTTTVAQVVPTTAAPVVTTTTVAPVATTTVTPTTVAVTAAPTTTTVAQVVPTTAAPVVTTTTAAPTTTTVAQVVPTTAAPVVTATTAAQVVTTTTATPTTVAPTTTTVAQVVPTTAAPVVTTTTAAQVVTTTTATPTTAAPTTTTVAQVVPTTVVGVNASANQELLCVGFSVASETMSDDMPSGMPTADSAAPLKDKKEQQKVDKREQKKKLKAEKKEQKKKKVVTD